MLSVTLQFIMEACISASCQTKDSHGSVPGTPSPFFQLATHCNIHLHFDPQHGHTTVAGKVLLCQARRADLLGSSHADCFDFEHFGIRDRQALAQSENSVRKRAMYAIVVILENLVWFLL